MSKLLEVFKQTKIDFSKAVISFEGGSGGIDFFKIRPKDFIKYAKEDFKLSNQKGYINSISNAKRAIDCQIDTVLKYFGIDFDNIPNQSEALINLSALKKTDLPHKLKLIQALKFAPSGLTNKARNSRNKLEHYYDIPKGKEIEEAIEIAELFIMSCESKTKIVDDDFIISSSNFIYKSPHPDIPKYEIDLLSNQIRVSFDYQTKSIAVAPTVEKIEKPSIFFNQHHEEFYFLIRLINSIDDEMDFRESLILTLDYIKHPIPQSNVKIDEWI